MLYSLFEKIWKYKSYFGFIFTKNQLSFHECFARNLAYLEGSNFKKHLNTKLVNITN